MGEYEKATKCADRALEVDKDNTKALIRRAICHRHAYRFSEAAKDLSRFMTLAQGNEDQIKVRVVFKSVNCWQMFCFHEIYRLEVDKFNF